VGTESPQYVKSWVVLLNVRSRRWWHGALENPEGLYVYCFVQCLPTFSASRYPWPRSSYLTIPLEENTYFLKLICSLIISCVRDKVVYRCWVSIYALINYVILFIYFLFLHLAVPQGSVRGIPGYRGTPVGNHWLSNLQAYVSGYKATLIY
jgi:hypothetical protein